MSKDTLGDYLKNLESQTSEQRVSDASYLYMRLDGRAFSSLTKSMEKPIDRVFFEAMSDTALDLFNDFSPFMIMKQSDEISILWKPLVENQERLFGGKHHKLLSVIPAHAASVLTKKLHGYTDKTISFDARLVECTFDDVILFFWWRYKDCYRNSVSMIANHLMSHKTLTNMSHDDRLEKIGNTNLWQDAPWSFKYGLWYNRAKKTFQPDDPRFHYIPEEYRPTEPMTVSVVNKLYVDKPFENYSEFRAWFKRLLLEKK